jgi:hypothetical protein
MSTVNNGPQIVRSGLVLSLDAGNGKSYSTNRFQALGSGTVTENVTFAINGTGTFQRVASGTVIGGYTVRPNDVVYSYALGVLGCHYHGNSAPIPAGSYATFSFDYLVTGATTYPITDYLASLEGVASGAIATANSLQNVWQRRSFTSAIISTSGNMNMYLYPGACGSTRLADSGTIYYRNPKVEITNVDTGNSTFNSTSNIGLWYDLSGNGYNGTLNGPTSNVSNKGNLLFNGSSQYVSVGSLITGNQSFSWGAWIYPTATGTPVFFGNVSIGLAMVSYWDSANNKVRVGTYGADRLTSGTAILPSTWGYTFWTWNGITLASYTNGIADGTATGFSFNISNLYTTIGNAVNAQYFNGRIAQTLVYNRTLTATEVSQNYEATKTRFGL